MTRSPEREKGDTKDTVIEDRRKTFSKVPIEKKKWIKRRSTEKKNQKSFVEGVISMYSMASLLRIVNNGTTRE